MDQPPRRSRYFEVEAPARPLRKRPRPGETARLEALRSYLAARGVARAEDVLRWTVEVKRRAGGRSAGTLDAYFVDELDVIYRVGMTALASPELVHNAWCVTDKRRHPERRV